MIDPRFQTSVTFSLPKEVCTSCPQPNLPDRRKRLTNFLVSERFFDWSCCSCCATSRSLKRHKNRKETLRQQLVRKLSGLKPVWA